MRSIAAGIVAALSVGVYVKTGGADGSLPRNASSEPHESFGQRFFFGEQGVSFDERFAATRLWPVRAEREVADNEDRADGAIRLSEVAEPPPDQSAAADHPASKESTPVGVPPPASRGGDSNPGHADRHTAIYDIAAHTVYLPDGRALEAHSGLGSRLDDARYASARGRGPTPPNVYDLAPREHLFHGVRALRLIPVGDGEMFGRDGILAHSYMLGPSGQSNGCVAFSNYTLFLQAYLTGEVDRLAVVDRLTGDPPPHKTAARRAPGFLRRHFRQS
jgi:hypothetical protein